MKTLCRTSGTHTSFIITDLDPAYHQAALDLVYQQVEEGFARFAEEMILQTARVHPLPWEHTLLRFLQRVDGNDIQWFLGGSAALAARGLDIQPRDFDLIVADTDAARLGEILLDVSIEPALQVEKILPTEEWFCNWFGRAFLGARVEWVGGVDERADTPDISDFGPTAVARLETITWRGYTLQVPPFDLQLEVSERRGLTERAAKIRRVLYDKL